MKIQNKGWAGTALSVSGKVVTGDADGVFDLDEKQAKALLLTPGWHMPEVPPQEPQAPQAPPEAPAPDPEPEVAEEASEDVTEPSAPSKPAKKKRRPSGK